jgi:hypothetical protein
MSEQPFVQRVLAAWSGLALELPSLGIASRASTLPNGSKGVIEIQSRRQLALIEVWEQAQCLDITLHCNSAVHGTILAAGPCASWQDVEQRLHSLKAALLSEAAR